ncbi:hypothetical protein CBW65_10260 [Tumebacillus avium]|uniref:Uncharacterized protein n=1 Tax=Tumebacillus avium TaxID=1903704 RepID=A0A1Y0IMQ9_9BACL|nr:hypothetical protein [Tumebacillus avium]ARU61339.1 hypothetical protein CBW65_10260 [Tumebacillus avium]
MKKAGVLALLVVAIFATQAGAASAATTNIFYPDPLVTNPDIFDPDPEISNPFDPDPLVQSN